MRGVFGRTSISKMGYSWEGVAKKLPCVKYAFLQHSIHKPTPTNAHKPSFCGTMGKIDKSDKSADRSERGAGVGTNSHFRAQRRYDFHPKIELVPTTAPRWDDDDRT